MLSVTVSYRISNSKSHVFSESLPDSKIYTHCGNPSGQVDMEKGMDRFDLLHLQHTGSRGLQRRRFTAYRNMYCNVTNSPFGDFVIWGRRGLLVSVL